MTRREWLALGGSALVGSGCGRRKGTGYPGYALVATSGEDSLAVVDLTKVLNPAIVPRTVAGHGCASGTLPASVVSFVSVP